MTDVTAPAAERCRKLVRRSTVPRQTAAALQGTVPFGAGDCPRGCGDCPRMVQVRLASAAVAGGAGLW